MKKLNSYLIILLGILLILPLIGVTQLGSITNGALAWIIAIVVLIIGILQLTNKK